MTGSKEFFLKEFIRLFYESALQKDQFDLIDEMYDFMEMNRGLLLNEIFGSEQEKNDFCRRCGEAYRNWEKNQKGV